MNHISSWLNIWNQNQEIETRISDTTQLSYSDIMKKVVAPPVQEKWQRNYCTVQKLTGKQFGKIIIAIHYLIMTTKTSGLR